MSKIILLLCVVFSLSLSSLAMSKGNSKIKLLSVYDEVALGDIIKAFTDSTGIEVELVSASSTELLAQLKTQNADLYLDKDIIYLNQAQRQKALVQLDSEHFDVPAQFFSAQRDWMLIFYRTRTLVFNENLIDGKKLTSYFDLGNKEFEGKVCMREASSSYNKAWTGYLLANHAADKVYSFLGDLSQNAVRPLFTSDRDIIRAVASGDCYFGLVNTYYLPKFIIDDASFPVKPRFVEQNKVGAHINGIGMALLKTAQNQAGALTFMQFMTSQDVQTQVGQAFQQYPVNPKATIGATLQSFGTFKIDFATLSSAGFFHELSYKLMTEQGL